MKKICLITTGGTIASRFIPETGETLASSSSAYFSEIAKARGPEIVLEAKDFSTIGSYEMDLETAYSLVQEIRRSVERDDVAGVVVTHGTDTLEETAFLSDLLVSSDKPVVFTGAQLAADSPESDGPRNFINALRVAASEEALGLGTLVVFDQEIHAARDVAKTHSSQVGSFQSLDYGCIGVIDQARVYVRRNPRRQISFNCSQLEPRIDIIKMALGSDRRFIDCALQSGAKGLVIEAFGLGNVTPSAFEAIGEAAAAGVAVVITTRCPRGSVAPVYGRSGGAGLERMRTIFGGDLSSIKARILLAVLLGEPNRGEHLEEKVRAVST